MTATRIQLRFRAVDGTSRTRNYKTLKAAQTAAQLAVGETPELGSSYAVSGDGVSAVYCGGCELVDLFPALKPKVVDVPKGGNRLKVVGVCVARQFEAYTFTGDDGYPASAVFSPVGVTVEDGRDFYLPQGRYFRDDDGFLGYSSRYDTDALVAKVRAAGSIDPDLWVEVEPIDLEREWGPEAAYREREDAHLSGY